jgi:hypothetical protein
MRTSQQGEVLARREEDSLLSRPWCKSRFGCLNAVKTQIWIANQLTLCLPSISEKQ